MTQCLLKYTKSNLHLHSHTLAYIGGKEGHIALPRRDKTVKIVLLNNCTTCYHFSCGQKIRQLTVPLPGYFRPQALERYLRLDVLR